MREFTTSEKITILAGREVGAEWAELARMLGAPEAEIQLAFEELRADAVRLKLGLLRRAVAREVGADRYRDPDSWRAFKFYEKTAGESFVDSGVVIDER
ncbi:hypothetical protein [Longispora albida]|uniref:hypothetical protein n=1 Tax=Longispora albida TaxID=203523 RepID=UPI0003602126|nr:hypothetical protein [Longispora albida]